MKKQLAIHLCDRSSDFGADGILYVDNSSVGDGKMVIFNADGSEAAFQDEVQARMPGSVWTDGGCRSWYLDANGRNSTLWPDFTWRYALRTRRFELADYRARLDLPTTAPPARPMATVA